MNGLLLDTCAVIWMASGEGLTEAGKARLMSAYRTTEQVLLSPISAWELGMLSSKGRITLTLDSEAWLETFCDRFHVGWAQMTPRILLRSSFLPGQYHGDPADRIILSTARELGLTILTGDRAMLEYGSVGHASVTAT